jgi:hypothetical protein
MATITKTQLAQVRADLNAALAMVATKHGIDFAIGTIRFNADTMRTTLSGVARGAAGTSTAKPTDPKLVAFLTRGARLLGHPSINENDKFHSLSLGTVKFVGYNTRAKAYPFIVQTTGGKRYKINEARAKALADSGIVV